MVRASKMEGWCGVAACGGSRCSLRPPMNSQILIRRRQSKKLFWRLLSLRNARNARTELNPSDLEKKVSSFIIHEFCMTSETVGLTTRVAMDPQTGESVESVKEISSQSDIFERSLAPFGIYIQNGLLCQHFGGNISGRGITASGLTDFFTKDPETGETVSSFIIPELSETGDIVGLITHLAKDPEACESVESIKVISSQSDVFERFTSPFGIYIQNGLLCQLFGGNISGRCIFASGLPAFIAKDPVSGETVSSFIIPECSESGEIVGLTTHVAMDPKTGESVESVKEISSHSDIFEKSLEPFGIYIQNGLLCQLFGGNTSARGITAGGLTCFFTKDPETSETVTGMYRTGTFSMFKTYIDCLHLKKKEMSRLQMEFPMETENKPSTEEAESTFYSEFDVKKCAPSLSRQTDICDRLTRSMVPNIWDLDLLKKHLLCQAVKPRFYKPKNDPPPFGPNCLWCNKPFADSSTKCKPNYCEDLSQYKSLYLAMLRLKSPNRLPCHWCLHTKTKNITYHSSPKALEAHMKKHSNLTVWCTTKCSLCEHPFESKEDVAKHLPFCGCVANDTNEKRTERHEKEQRNAKQVLYKLGWFGYKADSGLENPSSKLPKDSKSDSDKEDE